MIYKINKDVVIKVPFQFYIDLGTNNSYHHLLAWSLKALTNKVNVYNLFSTNPHLNIVHHIHILPGKCLFLKQVVSDLQTSIVTQDFMDYTQ